MSVAALRKQMKDWWPGASGAEEARRPVRPYDLALAGFMAIVVSLFVLPLPTAAMDALISLNLAISIVLLTVSTYLPSALSFSSFPAMLLFTTLLRLSLNIASCKLILLHANAGHIIDAFGRLVVGNNFVVGGVVFLVIAIVQFIVIAKGSERVAEVGARFSLDAMPGKQMSIDADLRAGIISSEEAKHRRERLEQESQLHGAMDGAMKFVKGDAIAGTVVAFVNILAGIAVGTIMKDMSVSDALHRYAILTVGDGMSAQIPSLLVSIAAGVVTTRVATRDANDSQLGEQIGKQVTAHPRALLIASAVLLAFAFVPGFPAWSFGLLALVTGGGGALLLRRRKTMPPLKLITLAEPIAAGEQESQVGPHTSGVTSPLAVTLARTVSPHLNLVRLQAALAVAKSNVEADIGPVFPRVHVAFDTALPEGRYQVFVQDVLASEGQVRLGRLLWDGTTPLEDGVERTPGEPFGPFPQPVWLPLDAKSAEPRVKQAPPPPRIKAVFTVETVTPESLVGLRTEEVVARHVESEVRKHAAALIGIQEAQHLIRLVRRDYAELVAELMRLVPLQRITEVLRRLLLEDIPIRNLRIIFESMITWAPREPDDTIALVELVRVDLRRMITDRHVGNARKLDVILFEPVLQERFEQAVLRTKQGNVLGLAREVKDDVCRQVSALFDGHQGTASGGMPRKRATSVRTAVVVSLNVRRYVRTTLAAVLPDLPVLSYQELEEDVELRTIGWVSSPAIA
ncbi:EscV/YscV/HrcV family type III secretion system export apparatus protein [Trinickia dinghuensis]|uniref:EscV/YscV/HrcV family type III secretion system export apparatus protein n=2 Tax=Trinickia dinghuensis TaxID=2291023 RepID=A0A3D8JY50_9BURK|nr:flagellar biosynthesis protein FlhA [Trinickia dinghuensis]RDU98073.1 EscV/YscV/HrcV family type III secretion system export apparatus protein [Trinickia dinghuensis]